MPNTMARIIVTLMVLLLLVYLLKWSSGESFA